VVQDNDELGLVQARWSFVNKDENLLTRLQNINLSFHFEVEQQVNGIFINFFGFNGTAGVWRIKALEEAGGWLERTTVEDMDIAVRAHLHGWKFVFLNDVEVCRLPSTLSHFQYCWFNSLSLPVIHSQTHFKLLLVNVCSANVSYRNHMKHTGNSSTDGILGQCSCSAFVCLISYGPGYAYVCVYVCVVILWQMFLLLWLLTQCMFLQISVWKKFNMIFLFFLLRKLILPFYSFTLFCIILPMTMFVPEAELPAWVVCYIPAAMSFLNILPAPKAFPFIVPYLLFENTMSVTKFNAMISGLFQLGSAYEWVVTKKSGRSSEGDLVSLIEKGPKLQRGSSAPDLEEIKEELRRQEQKTSKKKKKHNRIYMKELALAFLLLTASARSLLSAQGIHFYFLLFQGISFLLVGLDLIGEQVD